MARCYSMHAAAATAILILVLAVECLDDALLQAPDLVTQA